GASQRKRDVLASRTRRAYAATHASRPKRPAQRTNNIMFGNKCLASGSFLHWGRTMGSPGGQRTVQRLVDDHYIALYRYAYRLTGSADQAGDLTQETFCKAQAQFSQLRDINRAKAWLFSILRNAYLHKIRSDRQHRQVSLENVGELPGSQENELPDV